MVGPVQAMVGYQLDLLSVEPQFYCVGFGRGQVHVCGWGTSAPNHLSSSTIFRYNTFSTMNDHGNGTQAWLCAKGCAGLALTIAGDVVGCCAAACKYHKKHFLWPCHKHCRSF